MTLHLPAVPGVATDTPRARRRERARLPAYDRASLTPSVVHLGVGGFHRAHQAVYLDELAERGNTDWGIVGVSLRRRAMKDALDAQGGLFTVLQRGPDGDEARVVGSLVRMLFAPAERDRVLRALASTDTKVVTLTVTEQGYTADDDDGATAAMPLLADALAARRASGAGPFTVLSCDNVPGNGDAARLAVLAIAERRDPGLAAWIEREVAFPNSMVDRITPATTDDIRALLRRRYGLHDRWPVVTERFTQWVVEDRFCNGRPPLEEVGVEFVADVAPYERMKKRLLNGGQSALGYVGALLGCDDTASAMADPVLRRYVQALLRDEIAPLVAPVPGIDLDDYRRTLLERLANPAISDGLDRLCRRGSAKVPAHLLPSIAEARRAGRPHELLTLATAAWLRYLRGVDLDGRPIAIADPRSRELQAIAAASGDDPRRLMALEPLFGWLGEDPMLVRSVARALEAIDREGLRATIARYLRFAPQSADR
jgi:mannitol 2-dehydrogenase